MFVRHTRAKPLQRRGTIPENLNLLTSALDEHLVEEREMIGVFVYREHDDNTLRSRNPCGGFDGATRSIGQIAGRNRDAGKVVARDRGQTIETKDDSGEGGDEESTQKAQASSLKAPKDR